MTTEIAESSVKTSVVVKASPERAFEVFTAGIGTWWPPEHHLLEGELDTMVFETFRGGRVYDRGTDGAECTWARVLEYEPPERFVISWDISVAWQIETDQEKTSEVEVRFVSQGEGQTLVELEHRNLHRHGPGWETMRDSVASPEGWDLGLGHYADAVAQGG
jgi:uncharacterized protein YndB with AHSA1/START domain